MTYHETKKIRWSWNDNT